MISQPHGAARWIYNPHYNCELRASFRNEEGCQKTTGLRERDKFSKLMNNILMNGTRIRSVLLKQRKTSKFSFPPTTPDFLWHLMNGRWNLFALKLSVKSPEFCFAFLFLGEYFLTSSWVCCECREISGITSRLLNSFNVVYVSFVHWKLWDDHPIYNPRLFGGSVFWRLRPEFGFITLTDTKAPTV